MGRKNSKEKTSIDNVHDLGWDRFEEGSERCKIFFERMKVEGFDLDYDNKTFGEEYFGNIDRNPKTLKDKYDFYLDLKDKIIYFEVSGTDSENVYPSDPIWIREHKLDFLKDRKGIVYFVHILNNRFNLIRVIRLDTLKNEFLDSEIKEGLDFIHVYYYVKRKYYKSFVMSFDEFVKVIKKFDV